MAYFIQCIKTAPSTTKPKKGLFDFLKSKPKEPPKASTPEKPSLNKMAPSLKHSQTKAPKCEECHHAMNLIIQVDDPRIVKMPLLVFQCQQDEGCSDWEPDSGANKVLTVPSLETTHEPNQIPFEFIQTDITEETLQDIDEGYFEITQHEPYKNIIGKALGAPIWIQADDTPECCNQPMDFIFQIEEESPLNFGGGGMAYVFGCQKCQNHKFLWQC